MLSPALKVQILTLQWVGSCYTNPLIEFGNIFLGKYLLRYLRGPNCVTTNFWFLVPNPRNKSSMSPKICKGRVLIKIYDIWHVTLLSYRKHRWLNDTYLTDVEIKVIENSWLTIEDFRGIFRELFECRGPSVYQIFDVRFRNSFERIIWMVFVQLCVAGDWGHAKIVGYVLLDDDILIVTGTAQPIQWFVEFQ